MKRMAYILIALLALLFVSCGDDKVPYTSCDLVYTVKGSGTLTTANIMLYDDNGVKQVYSNVSLPATYTFLDSKYSNTWIWAQNNTSSFSDTLSVAISIDGTEQASGSSYGEGCISVASYTVHFGQLVDP